MHTVAEANAYRALSTTMCILLDTYTTGHTTTYTLVIFRPYTPSGLSLPPTLFLNNNQRPPPSASILNPLKLRFLCTSNGGVPAFPLPYNPRI